MVCAGFPHAYPPATVYALLFILGMMIIIVFLKAALFFEIMVDKIISLSTEAKITGLSQIPAVLPNDVSNVHAAMPLEPLTQTLGGHIFWFALAMSITLAGNLTLISSIGNMIVAQQDRRRVWAGFMEHFRVGALITAAVMAINLLVLAVDVRVANSAEAFAAEPKGKQMTVTMMPRGHAAGRRTFTVVLLCDSDQSRAKGLQGFRSLQPKEAALFVFDRPEAVTFWMGSVTFPIDIIFVSPGGYVVEVSPHCMPGSREFYGSGSPVKWVVETAEGSGVMVGDRVVIK